MNSVYIFKVNGMLRPADLHNVREELKQQIAEGLLVLNGYTDFVGKELEVCGQTITVELIPNEAEGDQFIKVMQAAGVQLFNPDSTIRKPEEIGRDIAAYL